MGVSELPTGTVALLLPLTDSNPRINESRALSPTPDKPDVILAPPEPGDSISSFLNVRVADIAAFLPRR